MIALAAQNGTWLERFVREYAEDATAVRDAVENPETQKAACLTLDWINHNSVTVKPTYAQISDFAVNHFTARGEAVSFAEHASHLTTVNTALLLCDAKDLSEATG